MQFRSYIKILIRKKTRAETPSSGNHTELGVSALYLALLSATVSSGYVMLCEKKSIVYIIR